MRGPPPMASLRWLTSSWRRPAHSPEMSFCAKAAVATSVSSVAKASANLALDRTSIYVNPSDVYEATPAMSASGHQIGEADLVHLAQVGFLDPATSLRRLLPLGMHGRDRRDVELQPADRCDRELGLDEVFRVAVAVRVVTDEPCAVGELDHRAD